MGTNRRSRSREADSAYTLLVNIRLAQLSVRPHVRVNLPRILDVLDQAQADDLVVFPEGAISGYEPQDADYIRRLDAAAIEDAIAVVSARVKDVHCQCLIGSATKDDTGWHNSLLLLDGSSTVRRYSKVELSALDARHFVPGSNAGALWSAGDVRVGVVACRELLFPNIWASLKQRGAQVICHVNNAIQPHDALWRHMLITRAIEQSVFVCSVNNGSAPQGLPSMLVAPNGRILIETNTRTDDVRAARLDISEVIADLSKRTDY